MSRFVLEEGALKASLRLQVDEALMEKYGIDENYYWSAAQPYLTDISGKTFRSTFTFNRALRERMERVKAAVQLDLTERLGLEKKGDYWSLVLQDYRIDDALLPVTKASSTGFLPEHTWLFFFLSIALGIIGALLYILPKAHSLPGIRNNHIFQSSMHNRGWLGIATGVFLIGFYILLYFFPEHMVNWIILADPISEALRGSPADRWFLYGFLYTLAILVMGIRMLIKYRHSRYHIIRTLSVMFFQTAFAFLIPQILELLNRPAVDLKNIWPLDYSFFFEYRLNDLIRSGALGMFMLVWGIAFIVVGVPLFTYFFGKRWYCSWVCGCGGLAETLGDPYRQLSDKSLAGWQIERWMIHAVLVFAVAMTGLVLYTYLSGNSANFSMNRWLFLGAVWAAGAWLVFYHRKRFPAVPRQKLLHIVALVGAVATTGMLAGYLSGNSSTFMINSFQVRSWYGFYIGAGFAGVVGTGFYPFMGNRVWCRFGCPLAAYLGIVQRFRSRFRITANGGQCISCGNCSTYCEMGIDVRAYAQRGQDIVRASCVGCGICAAVCPRGVLRLENSAEDVGSRAESLRALHIAKE